MASTSSSRKERSPLGEEVFVKLGGSVITDKQRPSTPRPDLIARLAAELKAALEARPELRVVLGHGSGSFGHVIGARYHVRRGIADDQSWWGYAATGAAAARLNRVVADTFLAAGVPVLTVQPSASARCQGGRLVDMDVRPVCEALRHHLVPLVYGDVAFDEEQGCTIVSTEQVLAYLAHCVRPARMVMVGEVDGVYDDDPLANPDALRIPRITPETFGGLQSQLGGSHGVDVTGGMLDKVREMVDLVAQGCTERVHLVSGRHDGALTRVLLDAASREGTLIESTVMQERK
jgi:isopentenyl phosphate kinase